MDQGSPFDSFLPSMAFGDFRGTWFNWNSNGGLGGVNLGASYFPAMYLLLQLLQLISGSESSAVNILLISYLVSISIIVIYFLRKRGLPTSLMGLTLIFVSYPNLIAIVTGNFEMNVFVLLLLAAVATHYEKWGFFALCIGTATSFKLIPGIFALAAFVLIPTRLALRVLINSTKVCFLMTLTAIFLLPGGIIDKGFDRINVLISSTIESQRLYTDLMVRSVAGLHYGHSLLNGIHAVFGMSILSSDIWVLVFFFVGIVWSILAIWFMRSFHPNPSLVFGFLGCSGCLFVPTSTDYKLLYLLPAVILFMNETAHSKSSKFLIFLLVVTIAPKPYFYIGSDPFTNANVWLNPLLMLVFQFASVIPQLRLSIKTRRE